MKSVTVSSGVNFICASVLAFPGIRPQEAADGEINESEGRSEAYTIRAPVQPLAEAGQIVEQRHRKLEGKIALWFDPKSNQFIPKPNPGAMRWHNTEKRYQPFRDDADALSRSAEQ